MATVQSCVRCALHNSREYFFLIISNLASSLPPRAIHVSPARGQIEQRQTKRIPTLLLILLSKGLPPNTCLRWPSSSPCAVGVSWGAVKGYLSTQASAPKYRSLGSFKQLGCKPKTGASRVCVTRPLLLAQSWHLLTVSSVVEGTRELPGASFMRPSPCS